MIIPGLKEPAGVAARGRDQRSPCPHASHATCAHTSTMHGHIRHATARTDLRASRGSESSRAGRARDDRGSQVCAIHAAHMTHGGVLIVDEQALKWCESDCVRRALSDAPLGVCRSRPCAVLWASLLLSVWCMCCACCNCVLRLLCWELSVCCLVCTVTGVGCALRVRGARDVWLRVRWPRTAPRGVAHVGRRDGRAADPVGPHGSVPTYR